MFDRRVLEPSRGFLRLRSEWPRAASAPIRWSWFGFVVGLAAVPLIVLEQPSWAILPILVNRLLDGIDGALARQVGPTDRGAFLDIAPDFSSTRRSRWPLRWPIRRPTRSRQRCSSTPSLAPAAPSFAFAVIAAKRGLTSTAYPGRSYHPRRG